MMPQKLKPVQTLIALHWQLDYFDFIDMKHLNPRQEYVDRYDRITVEVCRRRENFHKNYKPSDDGRKVPDGWIAALNDLTLHYDLLYTTLDWWERKEETIRKWMDDDMKKDELLERTQPPENVKCRTCGSLAVMTYKDIYDCGGDGRVRVLFMFDCPNKCMPRRAFYDDGEEYRVKLDLCPKCQSVMDRDSERVEDKKIVTTNRCPKCGHISTEELDLRVKDETPDPDYEKDRQRFCLSEEAARKNLEEKHGLEEIAKLGAKFKEEEKRKDEYDEMKKIKKLTVVELEKLLTPAVEKDGYVKFQFGTPEMGKDVFLPFTARDGKPERKDRESSYDLERLIRKALADTNWRLMSDGTSYRLGFLSGRLRAYEREEDLLELATQKLKKLKKVKDVI